MTCPKCGGIIVYSYNIEYDSYYLRCRNDYKHWHEGCNKSTAMQYPKYVTYSERLVDDMNDSIDNGDDYYNGQEF